VRKPAAAEAVNPGAGAVGGERPDRGALFRSVRRGDREEFDHLMAAYREFLSRAIAEKMDSRLRTVMQPEDVMQDVLIAVYRGIAEAVFPSEAAFLRWLETIVRNQMASLARRHFCPLRGGGPPLSIDESGPGESSGGMRVADGIPCEDPSPSSEANRREVVEALLKVLSKLPPRYREVIRLRVFEDLSTREIAARIGNTEGGVRKLEERALKACRRALGRDSRGGEGKEVA
jgi:RNA polymerase sigma-70 factor (ECF subfamily)